MSTIIMGNRSGKETTTSQVGKGDLPQDYLSPTQKKLTSLAEVQQTIAVNPVDASSKSSSVSRDNIIALFLYYTNL